jgi:hypothetical protein
MTPFGRCETPEERKALLRRLLAVWDKTPALRLGQLVSNAAAMHAGHAAYAGPVGGGDPFYVEDEALLASAEKMVSP